MKFSLKKIVILVFSLSGCLFNISANDEVYKILNIIKSNYLSVVDYQADIRVVVDVDFINIPEKNAKIYFKQPDKIKYKTDGFMLMPKKGVDFSFDKLLDSKFNAFIAGNELIDSLNTEIIKIIPVDNNNEIILTTVWVDLNSKQVIQLEANTKKTGSFKLKFYYSAQEDVLPEKTEVIFEMDQFEIPFAFLFDTNTEILKKKEKKEKTTGIVTIYYSNYIINSGLEDSFFEKE